MFFIPVVINYSSIIYWKIFSCMHYFNLNTFETREQSVKRLKSFDAPKFFILATRIDKEGKNND